MPFSMTGWDGNVEAHASTLPRLEGHKWRPALQIEWRMRAEMSWSSVCGRWDMAIVQRPHNPRLDRYTVKIEYNQSGYTNSETSPSTPRPETSCNPPLSHTGSSQERAGKTKWQHP